MTTTVIRFSLAAPPSEASAAADVEYRRMRAYYMAEQAVICPRCKAGFGRECESTGGGNFAVVPFHKPRRARVAEWSDEQRHLYGELARRYCRSPWDAPADQVAAAESAAAPIPTATTKPATPKGVRLSENQAEEIERAAYNSGKTSASTAHFRGDHQHRQTILALAAKGILAEGPLSEDRYSREYTLTEFGWQVYRQHRLIIHRFSDERIAALIAEQATQCAACGPDGSTGPVCDECAIDDDTPTDAPVEHRLVGTELVSPMTGQCEYTCACGYQGRAWRWNEEHVPATGVAPIPPDPAPARVSRDVLRRAIYGDRRGGGFR